MFRYIALCWDTRDPTTRQTAHQFALKLQTPGSGWQATLVRPGLSVFAIGMQANVNAAFVLPPDRGVILGKLFRRSDTEESKSVVSLTTQEVSQILRTSARDLVQRYWGRYVAFLHDDSSGGVRILRDPSGTLPCYLVHHRGAWIAFSWIEDVLAMAPSMPARQVDWDYLAHYILSGLPGCRETAISGVTQVIPGEVVVVCGDARTSELYWNIVDFANKRSDENRANAAAALRRNVRACVQSWARCYDNLMLRLSGGLDSSIVLSCLAAGSTPSRVTCINYYSAGSDSDERRYARAAAAKARRELIECERNQDVRLERLMDIARTPNPSSYLGRLDADRMDAHLAASRGAPAVLTGAGGDQLFFQFASFRTAADYLQLRGLDAGFLAAAMDAARLGRVSIWEVLRFAFVNRLRRRADDPFAGDGDDLPFVMPDVAANTQRDRRFLHPALQDPGKTPTGKLIQLRYLSFAAEYYDPLGVASAPEPVHPLLSQPIVELCLRLPSYLLVRGGRDRALARHAFAADLPAEVAWRRSKGGMDEHAKLVLLRNLDFVRSMLLDGALVRRGIVDRTKLEEIFSGRPQAIESPVTELHTLLDIEVWLSRWSSSQQRAAA